MRKRNKMCMEIYLAVLQSWIILYMCILFSYFKYCISLNLDKGKNNHPASQRTGTLETADLAFEHLIGKRNLMK